MVVALRIESFDFLQVPLLEANGMPSATLPFWKAGINVPGLALITSNDVIKKNPVLVRKMVGLMQKSGDFGAAIAGVVKIRSPMRLSWSSRTFISADL